MGTGGLQGSIGGASLGGAMGSGGATGSGGSAVGGAAAGGTAAGGAESGGRMGRGGQSAGGMSAGGATQGGATGEGGAAQGGATGEGGAAQGGATGEGGAAQGGAATEGRSAGCDKEPTIPSSQYNNGQHISIQVGNMQRRYILNVPNNYDNTHAYRLVIAYHELNGNDNEMYANDYYHLLPLSNDSAIFVAPNGQQNGSPCTGTGTGEGGCGWPNPNNTDIDLADAVVAQIEENFCVDTNRIFATGWSYGGSMSYKTACERPLGGDNGFVRAIAVYSGSQLSGNCTPSHPVAYYASHGTHDSVLCYDSTSSSSGEACQVGDGVSLFENFANANGCTYQVPTKVTSGPHVCTELSGCMDGYPTEFCSFNGDHTPDPSDGGQSWEYQTAWDFLSQF